jgi:hypothetical protein
MKGLSQQEILKRLEHLEEELRALKEQVAATPQEKGKEGPLQPLYGIWKGKFPEDFDVEAELKELRAGWEGRLRRT